MNIACSESEKVPSSSIELTNNTSCHDTLDKKTTPHRKHGESTYILHSIYVHGSHAPWPARKMYARGPSVILTLAPNELII